VEDLRKFSTWLGNSYFSLPHFSLGKKSKRKMWERKIREAYRVENFRILALGTQRICQQYTKRSHSKGSAVLYLNCAHPNIRLPGCVCFSKTINPKLNSNAADTAGERRAIASTRKESIYLVLTSRALEQHS
jgi:hypothetical protein